MSYSRLNDAQETADRDNNTNITTSITSTSSITDSLYNIFPPIMSDSDKPAAVEMENVSKEEDEEKRKQKSKHRHHKEKRVRESQDPPIEEEEDGGVEPAHVEAKAEPINTEEKKRKKRKEKEPEVEDISPVVKMKAPEEPVYHPQNKAPTLEEREAATNKAKARSDKLAPEELPTHSYLKFALPDIPPLRPPMKPQGMADDKYVDQATCVCCCFGASNSVSVDQK